MGIRKYIGMPLRLLQKRGRVLLLLLWPFTTLLMLLVSVHFIANSHLVKDQLES